MRPIGRQGLMKRTSGVRSRLRPGAILIATVAAALLTGCKAPEPDGPRVLGDITILLADRPVEKVLEPDPYGNDAYISYDGDGALRTVTRYEQNLLKRLAEAGKGATLAFQRHLEFPMDTEVQLEASAKPFGLSRAWIQFWVVPEACCGLRMEGATVRVEDAHGNRQATFSLEWPWGNQIMVQLPPTHDGGHWTWIIFDMTKDNRQPAGPQP
ncbi:MAG: hypothetical protein JXL80_14585 [Planctomycetes bacterium]|nr:hypothetical protein [Planctomycetota bacterium]